MQVTQIAVSILQYVTNQATRIIVKAAGDLSPQAVAALGENSLISSNENDMEVEEGAKYLANKPDEEDHSLETTIDIETYKPTILPNRSWKLSELDLGKCISPCRLP